MIMNNKIVAVTRPSRTYSLRWAEMERNSLEDTSFTSSPIERELLLDLTFVVRIPEKDPISKTLGTVQEQIKNIIGIEHQFMPKTSFHISVLSHTYFVDSSLSQKAPPDFLIHYMDYTNHLCNIATAYLYRDIQEKRAWPVIYKRLIATNNSIIAVASDRGQMNALRKKMCRTGIAQGVYPEDRINNLYPKIIHTTLVSLKTPLTTEQKLAIHSLDPFKSDSPYAIQRISFEQLFFYSDFDTGNAIDEIDLKK